MVNSNLENETCDRAKRICFTSVADCVERLIFASILLLDCSFVFCRLNRSLFSVDGHDAKNPISIALYLRSVLSVIRRHVTSRGNGSARLHDSTRKQMRISAPITLHSVACVSRYASGKENLEALMEQDWVSACYFTPLFSYLVFVGWLFFFIVIYEAMGQNL